MATYAMIDIEALDTSARACILGIGFVFFTEDGINKSVYLLPEIQKQLDSGRRVCAVTLKFLMEQDGDACGSVLTEDAHVSVSYTIDQLRELDKADFILCHDIDLDLGAIIDFYNQFALDNRVPLFDYRKKRCFKTISYMFDPHFKLQPERTMYHNALDNAIVQAQYFLNLKEKHKFKLG